MKQERTRQLTLEDVAYSSASETLSRSARIYEKSESGEGIFIPDTTYESPNRSKSAEFGGDLCKVLLGYTYVPL